MGNKSSSSATSSSSSPLAAEFAYRSSSHAASSSASPSPSSSSTRSVWRHHYDTLVSVTVLPVALIHMIMSYGVTRYYIRAVTEPRNQIEVYHYDDPSIVIQTSPPCAGSFGYGPTPGMIAPANNITSCHVLPISDDIIGVIIARPTTNYSSWNMILYRYSIAVNQWIQPTNGLLLTTVHGRNVGCGGYFDRIHFIPAPLPLPSSSPSSPSSSTTLSPSAALNGSWLMMDDPHDGDWFLSLSNTHPSAATPLASVGSAESYDSLTCYRIPSFPLHIDTYVRESESVRQPYRSKQVHTLMHTPASSASSGSSAATTATPYLYHWRLDRRIRSNQLTSPLHASQGVRLNVTTGEWTTVTSPILTSVTGSVKSAARSTTYHSLMVSVAHYGILYLPSPDGRYGHVQFYDSSHDQWYDITHWTLPPWLVHAPYRVAQMMIRHPHQQPPSDHGGIPLVNQDDGYTLVLVMDDPHDLHGTHMLKYEAHFDNIQHILGRSFGTFSISSSSSSSVVASTAAPGAVLSVLPPVKWLPSIVSFGPQPLMIT